MAKEEIAPGDLLYSPHGAALWPNNPFRMLLSLPEFAKTIGIKQRPELMNDLNNLYRYIRKQTGHWRDEEVSAIVNQRFPHLDLPETAHGLSDIRQRLGCTDTRA
jgi:hypothetical protein